MKKIIGQYIANICQRFLVLRIHREIRHSIFSQLGGKKPCGYPFGNSLVELEKLALFGRADTQLELAVIEKGIEKMPETYGNAFRYIMYRDLKTRAKMYAEFARQFNARKPASDAQQKQAVATA